VQNAKHIFRYLKLTEASNIKYSSIDKEKMKADKQNRIEIIKSDEVEQSYPNVKPNI
jgi:hypothetical protein